jgi:hypothetical protein
MRSYISSSYSHTSFLVVNEVRYLASLIGNMNRGKACVMLVIKSHVAADESPWDCPTYCLLVILAKHSYT